MASRKAADDEPPALLEWLAFDSELVPPFDLDAAFLNALGVRPITAWQVLNELSALTGTNGMPNDDETERRRQDVLRHAHDVVRVVTEAARIVHEGLDERRVRAATKRIERAYDVTKERRTKPQKRDNIEARKAAFVGLVQQAMTALRRNSPNGSRDAVVGATFIRAAQRISSDFKDLEVAAVIDALRPTTRQTGHVTVAARLLKSAGALGVARTKKGEVVINSLRQSVKRTARRKAPPRP